jgi:3-dehydroquinate synthetase
VTRSGTADRLAGIVVKLGLPLSPESPAERGAILGFVRSDKKARQGRARYVLLEELGRVARADGWSREVPEKEVEMLLEDWASRGKTP